MGEILMQLGQGSFYIGLLFVVATLVMRGAPNSARGFTSQLQRRITRGNRGHLALQDKLNEKRKQGNRESNELRTYRLQLEKLTIEKERGSSDAAMYQSCAEKSDSILTTLTEAVDRISKENTTADPPNPPRTPDPPISRSALSPRRRRGSSEDRSAVLLNKPVGPPRRSGKPSSG